MWGNGWATLAGPGLLPPRVHVFGFKCGVGFSCGTVFWKVKVDFLFPQWPRRVRRAEGSYCLGRGAGALPTHFWFSLRLREPGPRERPRGQEGLVPFRTTSCFLRGLGAAPALHPGGSSPLQQHRNPGCSFPNSCRTGLTCSLGGTNPSPQWPLSATVGP